MEKTNLILAVEDSDEDYAAFTRILREFSVPVTVRRVCDGDETLNYLYRRDEYGDPDSAPRPSLILLDLNLPGIDGLEVIEQIKHDDTLKTLPIVVLTTSSSPKDIEASYQLGANSYLIKPIGVDVYKQTIRAFLDYWFTAVVLPERD